MAHAGDDAYWRDLESHAHLPEVQEVIREEIRKRTIASVRILTAAFGSCRFALPKAVAEVIEPSPVPTHLTNTSSMTTGVFASIECFKFAGMWTHVPA